MARLDEVKPAQTLYSKSSADGAMPWRNGLHRIRIERVQLTGARGVVASWNNRAPRFYPEQKIADWELSPEPEAQKQMNLL